MQEQLRFKLGDSVNVGRTGKVPHVYSGKIHKVIAETVYDVKVSSCSCEGCKGKVLTFYAWDLTYA